MTVYFIAAHTGHVKIGWAGSVSERLRALQAGNPQPLRLLATLPGGEAEERVLHTRFRDYRVHGEWFECRGSLAAYLAELRGAPAPGFRLTPREVDRYLAGYV